MTSTNNTMRDSAVILGIVGLACLLGIGLAVNWTTALVIVVVGVLLWLGYWVAVEKFSYERARLDAQRRALDAEWRALEQTGRVRSIFLQARRAMQDEAGRWPVEPDEEGK
jgi:hypothetical protein